MYNKVLFASSAIGSLFLYQSALITLSISCHSVPFIVRLAARWSIVRISGGCRCRAAILSAGVSSDLRIAAACATIWRASWLPITRRHARRMCYKKNHRHPSAYCSDYIHDTYIHKQQSKYITNVAHHQYETTFCQGWSLFCLYSYYKPASITPKSPRFYETLMTSHFKQKSTFMHTTQLSKTWEK